MAKQNYNVRVTLSDQQVAALMVGFTAVGSMEVIQSIAQDAVVKLADGGIAIPAPVVKRIEKILGKIDETTEIAEAVEASVGMEGDNIVVSMTMDPVWVNELKQKAEMVGTGLDALCSELQSQIMHQGLLYDMATYNLPIYVTPEQHRQIQAALGFPFNRPVFGEDVARKLGWKPTDEDGEDEDLFVKEKAS